jgi:hypothetical protein
VAARFPAWLGAIIAALGICTGAAPAAELHHAAFFVAAGALFDPNGNEFHIRGVNRLHWDSPSAAGIARSHANTERWDIDFRRPAEANVALVREQSVKLGIVPVVGNWSATCSHDPSRLQAVIATWVRQASAWTQLNRYLIVNVANEWGPADSPMWRDAYVRAIAALRTAGYGGTTRDAIGPDLAQLRQLERERGMVFIVGEFGPGRRIGYTRQVPTAAEVISACEAHDIGWLAWAWDDYDLPGGRADDRWFSMTYAGPGRYRSDADLTVFGRDVVLDPRQGLRALARRASIFAVSAGR